VLQKQEQAVLRFGPCSHHVAKFTGLSRLFNTPPPSTVRPKLLSVAICCTLCSCFLPRGRQDIPRPFAISQRHGTVRRSEAKVRSGSAAGFVSRTGSSRGNSSTAPSGSRTVRHLARSHPARGHVAPLRGDGHCARKACTRNQVHARSIEATSAQGIRVAGSERQQAPRLRHKQALVICCSRERNLDCANASRGAKAACLPSSTPPCHSAKHWRAPCQPTRGSQIRDELRRIRVRPCASPADPCSQIRSSPPWFRSFPLLFRHDK
jgi:hypothetical protein